MPTSTAFARADWRAICQRALNAAAAVLAEAARRRSAAAPGAIDYTLPEACRAEIRVHEPALIQRERGAIGLPPAPFLTPDREDRAILRDAIADSLQKDLS